MTAGMTVGELVCVLFAFDCCGRVCVVGGVTWLVVCWRGRADVWRAVYPQTLLHYASINGQQAVAEFLVRSGADPNAKDVSDACVPCV